MGIMTHLLMRTTATFQPPATFLHRKTTPRVHAVHAVPFSGPEPFLIATAAAEAQAPSSQVFEAVAPDASLLVGFGSVLVLCIAAGFVWANDVVPVSRTKLAISKSRGDVREYLDGLKNDDGTSLDGSESTLTPYSEQEENVGESPHPGKSNGDGRGFERWLFSDWLNDTPGTGGGRKKEPALPILKKAKWNSGDNPVLVTVAIMMLGVVVASVTERIAT